MVVEFLSGSQLDLGSSFATIASKCDTEQEISPCSSAEREDVGTSPSGHYSICIKYLLSVAH